nr:unnamed protein product [Callosobruchus chinensis]
MIPQPGTYFYHSHSGLQRFDGLEGSLIVRQPRSKDPHSHLYDVDDPTHVIIINGWLHQFATEQFPGLWSRNRGQYPVNLLINGRGKWTNPDYKNISNTPFEVFNVQPGQRYRFRMINGMSSPCGCVLTIEGHNMTVIATDGGNVQPRRVDSICSYSGERYDFILEANQKPGDYWMQFWATDVCASAKITQFAVLHYNASPERTLGKQLSYENLTKNMGLTLNPPLKTCAAYLPNGVCVSDLRSATPVTDVGLLKRVPDIKIYVNYTFAEYEPQELFVPNTYTKYSTLEPGHYFVQSFVSGFAFILPSSPIISQYQDAEKKICNKDKVPKGCSSTHIRNCTCTHVMPIPLGSVVEVVFIDEVQFYGVHSFHLHGYAFHVLGMGSKEDFGLKTMNKESIMRLDQQGRLKRNFNDPPAKDSIVVPNHGYAVLRFRADNPGPWFFHCHFDVHMIVGMAFIFQVGELSDLPPVPDDFPRCGNYLPNLIDPALNVKRN